MATGFPFGDRRQRPCVIGAAAMPARQGASANGPNPDNATPSPDHIDPIRASARDRSYVDIASVTGGPGLLHRDVLG